MDFLNTARKKAEQIVEKGFMGVSDAIYATGSTFEKGGSMVTSFLASSAEAVGSGIYGQACNIVGVTKTSKVQEVLEANE